MIIYSASDMLNILIHGSRLNRLKKMVCIVQYLCTFAWKHQVQGDKKATTRTKRNWRIRFKRVCAPCVIECAVFLCYIRVFNVLKDVALGISLTVTELQTVTATENKRVQTGTPLYSSHQPHWFHTHSFIIDYKRTFLFSESSVWVWLFLSSVWVWLFFFETAKDLFFKQWCISWHV